MTAFITQNFVPLLFGAGEPGREILSPVAVTIFGGLASIRDIQKFIDGVIAVARNARPIVQRNSRNQRKGGLL